MMGESKGRTQNHDASYDTSTPNYTGCPSAVRRSPRPASPMDGNWRNRHQMPPVRARFGTIGQEDRRAVPLRLGAIQAKPWKGIAGSLAGPLEAASGTGEKFSKFCPASKSPQAACELPRCSQMPTASGPKEPRPSALIRSLGDPPAQRDAPGALNSPANSG